MSRAYKQQLIDEATDLGATGLTTVANAEKLSGADLEQMRLTALNGDTAVAGTGGSKTLGVNALHAGSPNSAKLSGADLERYAGDQ